MTEIEISTRNKILKTAHKLFAEKGINAVGVREIAKEAEVNVAAINYHFGNKETLYRETIKESLCKVSQGITDLYEDNCSTEELVSRIFDYFILNREDLITGFKLFLTDSSATDEMDQENTVGPPGGIILFNCIKKELPHVTDKEALWVVRTLFSQTLHSAILVCNHCENINKRFGITEVDFKNDILRLTRVLLNEIR